MSARICPKQLQRIVWVDAPATPDKVRACRACLATNIRLFDLKDSIRSTYEELTGSPIPEDDVLPKFLCTFCMVLLRKFQDFKDKCMRATDLLHSINNIKMLNTKFIKSVDRPYYNLNNNLAISTPVFMESDFIKEEIDLEEAEHIIYVKQENQEMDESMQDETPAEDEEAMDGVEYVFETDELYDEDGKQAKKIMDRGTLEEEYNMDIIPLTEEEQRLEIEARKQSQNYLKSNHRCEDCGKGFNSNETLTNHYNTMHHPDLGDFLCLLCKGRFDTKTKLGSHVNNHKYRYNCRECDFTTMRKWSANKHKNWHQGISYTCEICEKDFNMNTSYLSHMRIHHPPENIWCRYCGEAFISELGLKAHRRLKHANSIIEFICQTCGMTFLNEQALSIHNSVECCPNSCAQCGYSFESEKVLQAHVLEVHTGKVKVKRRVPVQKKEKRKDMKKCDLCDNVFNNEEVLLRHHDLMGGACGGMRACVQCGDGFLTGDMLKEHVIECHSEIEMLCPRCNRTFENSDDFNAHYKRVHMKKGPPRLVGTKTWGVTVNSDGPIIAEKHHALPTPREEQIIKTKPKVNPSFCEVCGKKCASSVHLTYHQRVHTGEKPYKCAICQKAFAVPKFLKEHFKVHTGERPFDCELCSKAFKSKSALNRHKLCHTGERRHICQICSKDFLTSSDVKTHIKSVHMKITGPPRVRRPKGERVAKDYCVVSEYSN